VPATKVKTQTKHNLILTNVKKGEKSCFALVNLKSKPQKTHRALIK
jgi:hypothetical protein